MEAHGEASSQRDSHGCSMGVLCLMVTLDPGYIMYRYEMIFSEVFGRLHRLIFVAVTSLCRSEEVEVLYGVGQMAIV